MFSFYLLDDPSFYHMMIALSDTINNSPPLYFVLGWVWAKIFSSSELSLRIFSCLGFGAGCVTLWITLRRTYDFWSATLSTAAVFGFSTYILYQVAEARFYGLMLFTCSLGLLHFDVLCKKDDTSKSVMLSTILVHAAMIQTHLFGFLYSGAILLALIIRDKYFSSLRPKIYMAVLIGWSTFLPWIGPFLNQYELARPRGWIPPPKLHYLIESVSLSQPFLNILLVLSGFLLLANLAKLVRYRSTLRFSTSESVKWTQTTRAELPLFVLALGFLAVPVFAWVYSHTIEPIYVGRYMIPAQLSLAILLAALFSRILFLLNQFLKTRLGSWKGFRTIHILQNLSLTTLFFYLLYGPITYAAQYPQEPLPGTGDGKFGYTDLPIAMEFSHPFIKRLHYSPERHRYYFILDWELAEKIDSGLFPPGEYKNMSALKRNYPEVFQNHVIQGQQFLEKFKRFLVVNVDRCTFENMICHRWFEVRIKKDPRYQWRQLGRLSFMSLILVERKE